MISNRIKKSKPTPFFSLGKVMTMLVVIILTAGILLHYGIIKSHPTACSQANIPRAAYMTAMYIERYGHAPSSYESGKVYYDDNRHLPMMSKKGQQIQYHESDIYPHLEDINRGARRLVYSNTGQIYYTDDHYSHFVLLTTHCINHFVKEAYYL